MGLKLAKYQRNDRGIEKQAALLIRHVHFDYADGKVTVQASEYPNMDEISTGVPPEQIDFIFNINYQNTDELNLVLQFSDLLWDRVLEVKTIKDWVLNETSKRVPVVKSLDDLNAVLIDIPGPSKSEKEEDTDPAPDTIGSIAPEIKRK